MPLGRPVTLAPHGTHDRSMICDCRQCTATKERRREQKRASEARRLERWGGPFTHPPRPPAHGTLTEYRKGCRCDECRNAERAYRAQKKETSRADAR